jgi:sigma-B regulation protein RsbU (phosphoserine phosphatase)
MINKSIAYRLKIYISVAVIVVFIIFILLLFFFNLRLLRENIENRAISLSHRINTEISKEIFTAREVTLNIASQIIYYGKKGDGEQLLAMVMQKYQFLNAVKIQLDSIYDIPTYYSIIRYEDSLNYEESYSPIKICKTEQKIIEYIGDKKEEGWTDPYRCDYTGKLLVTFYCPVYYSHDSGSPVVAGRVICELSLVELNNRINSIEIGKRGYAFIVNKNGDYISHPKEEWILNRNLYHLPKGVINIKESIIKNILNANESGSFIAFPEMFGSKKCWVYHTSINQNYWVLFFVMPYMGLFKDLYLITLAMILFAIIGITAIYQTITIISKRLIQPLSVITTKLNKLHRPENYRQPEIKNEILQVSDSLNYLQEWFDHYKWEQEQEETKNQRRNLDIIQASEIQQSFIKTDFSSISPKGIDLYASYKPAGGISGDLFDYFFIDDDNLVFTIGDVSGMGVPAALFMSISQVLIKKNATSKKAKIIVTQANKDLCTSGHHQFFLTLFLGILNIKTGVLSYCNAAHTATFIMKVNSGLIELDRSHGLPLGLYPDKKYKDSNILLEKGDAIILYTDGVTTLENKERTQYGRDRFRELLCKLPSMNLTAREIANYIEKNLENFKGETPQADDICILIIKYG